MSDDDETHLHATYASHFDMDEAFSARMRAAIAAGLENAPIGVRHHAWNQKAQIRPTGAMAASVLAWRNGLLV